MREYLSAIFCSRVEYHLEFQEDFVLRAEMMLQLRRELMAAARMVDAERLVTFLSPEPSDDPYARRLFQKPAPSFVIDPPDPMERSLGAGDDHILKVLFFGNVSESIALFARLLQQVGQVGIFKGEGCFEVNMIVARDPSGNQQLLWNGGELPQSFTAPQHDLLWLVDKHRLVAKAVVLRFVSPARLLSTGKPLFHADFSTLFPFIMRRVSSMLYSCCGVEPIGDPNTLLDSARGVVASESRLAWQDWRQLRKGDETLDLGGLMGEIHLTSGLSDDLWALLLLGEVLHIGKGAAFGSGCYRLQIEE